MTAFGTATETADRPRREETTSYELVEEMLARIDAVNPALNAVVELRREEAPREVDVFLCPVNFTAAFAHDDRPFGERIVGPRYEDDTAITFAEPAAEVIGGFEPPPR